MRHYRKRWLIVIVAPLLFAGCGGGQGNEAASTTAAAGAPSTATSSTATSSTTTTVAADAGTWSLIPDGPDAVGPPVAWTGTELLVAQAGCCAGLGSVNLNGYDPQTNTWHALPPTPLTPREFAAGAWTGTEMVLAGGLASPDGDAEHAVPVTDGAAWDAATDTWHPIAAMPTTLPAGVPTAVWTGREVLVWSSVPATAATPGREVVLAYNPTTDTWRTLPSSGLTPRAHAVTVWTGKELVVWGGLNSDFSAAYGDGARLDPATDTWRRLPPAPVPARGQASAVWSGHEVLLWGGDTAAGTEVGQGAAYDPSTNAWRALPLSPLRAKTLPAGVWTGRLFLVIGGSAGGSLPAPGPGAAAYDPATNTWTALPAAPLYPVGPTSPTFAADQREGGSAVWTGKAVVLVGGLDYRQQAPRSDGIEWTPAA
jgi:N-acetylneuraminic acid mutarotase